jgi:hypothetical protein
MYNFALDSRKKRMKKVQHSFSHRYRPRFFDQVGHQTTSAYIENKDFSTK